MENLQEPWLRPVFFRRNRVYRVYTGGKLFHELLGDPPEDGYMPEEWICSSVHAVNPGHTDPLEGISLRREDGKPFPELLNDHPKEYLGERRDLGVLVKYLDSAIRLPMQAHPTRAFSREHFHSPYGKAEAWLVLAARPGACVYYGFSRQVTPDEFAAAVAEGETDPDAMTRFVNRVPVEPGDVFFVSAGMIHAIGAGCLILEAQEPTDFTIQPEYWCGSYHLNSQEMYMGLSPETALGCFDFTRFGPQTVEQGRKEPVTLWERDGVSAQVLIGPRDTECFSMTCYTVSGGSLTMETPASIWICAEGEGRICSDGYEEHVAKGDYFFLPAAAAGRCRVVSEKKLTLVCCAGGK